MSNIERSEPYIYQPFGIQNKLEWAAGRIYGIGGWNLLTRIEGLTKPEAEAVLCALTATITGAPSTEGE